MSENRAAVQSWGVTSDVDLLTRWADGCDERAFRELVQRTGPLVHGVAVRRLGEGSGLAEEAAQRVFTMLARKAGALKGHPCLSAWLHRATVLETVWMAREEARRRQKLAELAKEADFMASSDFSPPEWQAALPEIDEALERLPDGDRRVLMLRYFEGRSFREIGRLLGKNEAAAQKQGVRALERLSATLRRRGVAASVAVLSAGLAGGLGSAGAAPLTAYWATAAASKAPGIGFFQSLNHSLHLMTYGKAIPLSAAAAALLLASLGGSYALGRHQAAGAVAAAPTLAEVSAEAADKGRGRARPRMAAGPGSVGLSQATGRDLRSRLEGLTKAVVVDPEQRSVNLMGFTFGPGGTATDGGGIADLASIDYDDLEPGIAIMGEWRGDAKKFETIAAMLTAIMSERDSPETVVKRLMTPEFSRNGKPPLLALGMTLRGWAQQEPKMAWDFFRAQSDAGRMPTDPWKPYFPEILTSYLARDTEAAVADVRRLPHSWDPYVKRALGESLGDKKQREAVLRTLESAADDRLALLAAASQPGKGQWTAGKLLPWLMTRQWERPDGAARALHSMIWSDGLLDEDRLSIVAGAIDQLPTPEANAAALRVVQDAFADVKAVAGEKTLRKLLERHVRNDALRQKIAQSL